MDFVIRAKDGKDYSARCAVTVLPCGLASPYIAVADGEKAQIDLVNAKFLSCELEWQDNENAGLAEISARGQDWDFGSQRAEVSVSRKGVITAKKTGIARLLVQYETAYHELKTEVLSVHVTKPEYIPFKSYLWAGESYVPQFEGISPYSVVTVGSEDGRPMQ